MNNKPEVVLNIEDIYYKNDEYTKKLLDDDKDNTNYCHKLFYWLFCCLI